MEASIVSWFTSVTAGIGASLGVFNLWRQVSSDRVKLRVTPSLVIERSTSGLLTASQGDGMVLATIRKYGGAVEISVSTVNLSTFPILVDEIGIARPGDERRPVFVGARSIANEHLPLKLEPRHAVQMLTQRYAVTEFGGATGVYVRTVCGHQFRATSPSFDTLVRVADEAMKAVA